MNIFIKTTSIFFLLSVFYMATPVFASEILIDSKDKSFAQGEEFLVQIFLNTEGQSVNAVDGAIVFPGGILEVKEIRDGNSSVNFWVEKPHTLESGKISFAGTSPGGLSLSKEFLFSIIFRTQKEGTGVIKAEELRVLLNDGLGTLARVKTSPVTISISKQSSPISIVTPPVVDTEPPEAFEPIIGNDPSIFDGEYFLVFTTQDKISGIESYQVREGVWGLYRTEESPYVLRDQSLHKKISVKAIDKSGNERIETIEPLYPLKWYATGWFWFIIGLGIIASYFVGRKLWIKKLK